MTAILSVETSTSACSVALLKDSQIYTRYSEESRSHSKLLLTMIDEVLAESGLSAADLDCLATGVGPGSFTGLRIGFGVIQGLAFAHNTPVVALSSLHMLAATAVRKLDCGKGMRIFAVTDARMGEFNCALYAEDGNGRLVAEQSDRLLESSAVLESLSDVNPDFLVGDATALMGEHNLSRSQMLDLLPDASDSLVEIKERFLSGEARPVEEIELIYLRGTEAWRKHERIRSN